MCGYCWAGCHVSAAAAAPDDSTGGGAGTLELAEVAAVSGINVTMLAGEGVCVVVAVTSGLLTTIC